MRLRGPPLILRLYGRGHLISRGSAEYIALLTRHFGGEEPLGARHNILLTCERIQTSCGYGVPQLAFVGKRKTPDEWAEKKGEAGLKVYRAEKNVVSVDGLEIG